MADIFIRDIDDELVKLIDKIAVKDNRSRNQEASVLLGEAVEAREKRVK